MSKGKPFKETGLGKVIWGIGDVGKSILTKTVAGNVVSGVLDLTPVANPLPDEIEQSKNRPRRITRNTLFILIIIGCIAEYFGIPAFSFIKSLLY